MDQKQYTVGFARFTYGEVESPSVADWVIVATLQAQAHPRVKEVRLWRQSDTPITMVRNNCLKVLRDQGVDFVIMIDNDMQPDLAGPGAKPFFASSFDFAIAHDGPCIIGAPYCGAPPKEWVHVTKWCDNETDVEHDDFVITKFDRQEAISKTGIENVPSMGTGLIMIDIRALEHIKPPWFYYEYTDEFQTDKQSTEDTVFTRNASILGVPVYVNWDAWAGHWKPKLVTKPKPFPIDKFSKRLHEAVLAKNALGRDLED